jgi:hypothetical protein
MAFFIWRNMLDYAKYKPNLVSYLRDRCNINATEDERFICPEHGGHAAQLNIQDNNFYCHACCKTYDIYDVAMLVDSSIKNKGQAWAAVAAHYGDKIDTTEPKKREKVLYEYGTITNDDIQQLNEYTCSTFFASHYGKLEGVYWYKDTDGQPLFAQVRTRATPETITSGRYKTLTDKQFNTYMKARITNPTKKGQEVIKMRSGKGILNIDPLPLYNLQGIIWNTDKKVLIVEGEKKADIKLNNYVSVSIKNLDKTDLKPLAGRDVIIWPDNDTTGIKKSVETKQALQGIAKTVEVMDVSSLQQKYDIWDLINKDGNTVEQIEQFIIESLKPKDIIETQPFDYLGVDNTNVYFYDRQFLRVIPFCKNVASIKNNLLNIANMNYWKSLPEAWEERTSKSGEVTTSFSYNNLARHILEKTREAGWYDDKDIRSTGAWKHEDAYFYNDGLTVFDEKWKTYSMLEVPGEAQYVVSSKLLRAPLKQELAWTVEDGKFLFDQFNKLEWSCSLDIYSILGFCVSAPFGGVFQTRPHLWLTAEKGTGKSFIMDKFISPLCRFSKLEGGSTEAGIRAMTRSSAVPILIDEAEPGNGGGLHNSAMSNIQSLARSSYSGANIGKSNASQGSVVYHVYSMFMFSSINVHFDDDAMKSRTAISRIKSKIKNGVMADMKEPKNYDGLRARIWGRIRDFVEDIKVMREIIKNNIGETQDADRTADTYSPFLVGSWYLLSDERVNINTSDKACIDILESIYHLKEIKETDGGSNDDFMSSILSLKIRTKETDKPVCKCLAFGDNKKLIHEDALNTVGIDVVRHKGVKMLTIDSNNSELFKLLKGSKFSRFSEMAKRHDCFNTYATVRACGMVAKYYLFDFDKIVKKYGIGETQTEQPDLTPDPFGPTT